MDSSGNYPSSLYCPPVCTFQDFCNGIDFKAFHSLYQQLNPYKPPALQYIQQHWIVLINDIFPDTLSEKTQLPTVNAVGQELKFQAFEYENVESVGAGGKALMPAKQAALKSWHKAPSLGAWGESTERSVVSSAPGAIVWTGLGEWHNGEATGTLPVSGPDRAYVGWPYHGIRAGKTAREVASQKWPESVASPASGADAVVEDWVLQTRITAKMLTSSAEASQVSNRQDSLASPLKRLEPLRSRKWKVRHGRAKSLTSQRSGQQSYIIATGEWPEPVDPCSLSRVELDVAITELLSTIQSNMGSIHPDRLKRAIWV
jgi:hypothetical protein